jgi:hypothetical protein
MGVYKGTKNNQNIGILPSLSHYLVECNIIQEHAHTRKTKTKQKKQKKWTITDKTRMLLFIQELTKN